MGTLYESLELLHTLVYISSDVGIDVIIIGYSVWRPCPTLYHLRVLTGYAIGRIVCSGGVTNDSCIPHMSYPHLFDATKHSAVEVIHLSATILLYRTILLTGSIPIAKETRKDLINNRFHDIER